MWKLLQPAALALCFMVSIGSQAATPVPSDPYRLGPDDRLRIRVYEWRDMYGQVHQDWAALNDEFTVGPTGELSLPLVGSVSAAGQTMESVTTAISDRLQIAAGMETRPKISVEVAKYRPFYILGEVSRPGEYPYRPGLTALQALGIAGGVFRPLEAAMAQLETAGGGAAVGSRRGTKEVLEREITVLQQKLESVDQEFGMLNGQLANARDLLKKGWETAPRAIALQQGVMKLQRERLDLDVTLLRAKKELAKLKNQDRKELSSDVDDVSVRLTDVANKRGTTNESIPPGVTLKDPVLSEATDEDSIVYTILRHNTIGVHELVGSDETLIQPGDTIKVKRQVTTPLMRARSEGAQEASPTVTRATPH